MQIINDFRWLNKVILVVEDDPINYQYIEALLKDTGLSLIQAKTGEEAIKICQENAKVVLVLMDIKLPFMSGYEATEKIKSFRKELPIIAQTAYFLNDDKIKCKKAGCDHYISKPIDTEELYSVLAKYLEP